ncbi:MAG: ribosome silencing factor [Kaiparowitsia implicata GSE-PSE-MK54-09C]|nr:ribosome silencing factor [Kaiparowitsia implicata GSE-PSE-MK54-09C]
MTNFPHASRSQVSKPSAPLTQEALSSPLDELDDTYRLALTVVDAADDRKGLDIVLLKVTDVSYLADYFVIITGLSMPQVRAIANSIEAKVEEQWDRVPLRKEGQADGRWLLIDYGEVVAHIFMPDERDFYSLEAFWGHAERVPLSIAGDSVT